jgi:hypothetical protein
MQPTIGKAFPRLSGSCPDGVEQRRCEHLVATALAAAPEPSAVASALQNDASDPDRFLRAQSSERRGAAPAALGRAP